MLPALEPPEPEVEPRRAWLDAFPRLRLAWAPEPERRPLLIDPEPPEPPEPFIEPDPPELPIDPHWPLVPPPDVPPLVCAMAPALRPNIAADASITLSILIPSSSCWWST